MITPADLLAPKGPVEVTLFPGENSEASGSASTKLEIRLQEYIDRAEAKVSGVTLPDPDSATYAWALHLTFSAAYILACSRPTNENTMVAVLGSQGFSPDQRAALRSLADYYLGEYESVLAAVPVDVPLLNAQSRQVTNRFEW